MRLGLSVLAVVAVGLFALAYSVPPSGWGKVLSECRYKQETGKNCVGCGGTRSAHALAHGQVGKAFYYNALFVSGIPLGLLYAGWLFLRSKSQESGRLQLVSPREGLTVLAVLSLLALVFWYVRNQPWFPLY